MFRPWMLLIASAFFRVFIASQDIVAKICGIELDPGEFPPPLHPLIYGLVWSFDRLGSKPR